MNSQDNSFVNQNIRLSPTTLVSRKSRRPERFGRLRGTTRFLVRAWIGGALGGYVLTLGIFWKPLMAGYPYLRVIDAFGDLAFFIVVGGLLGIVTRALTLVLENLIEEQLKVIPSAIASSAFTILVFIGVLEIYVEVDWPLVQQLLLPGLALGFPVGLVASAKVSIRKFLIHGTTTRDFNEGENLIARAVRTVGGTALRLVAILGFGSSILVLITSWNPALVDERLVITYAIYYYGCTILVSCLVRSRLMITAAGFFLNGLLLILAFYWEPSGDAINPLPLVLAIMSLLWIFFIGTARPVNKSRLSPSHQVS